MLRPYIPVSCIPQFDPTRLPYWDLYTERDQQESIALGGTMAGQFTAGLSGGQRKVFLLELLCQRLEQQKQQGKQEHFLILLDEPFAGVTDDFVPYIVRRLQQLQSTKQKRQAITLVIVTNDHVSAVTSPKVADHVLHVSSLDRSIVQLTSNVNQDDDDAKITSSSHHNESDNKENSMVDTISVPRDDILWALCSPIPASLVMDKPANELRQSDDEFQQEGSSSSSTPNDGTSQATPLNSPSTRLSIADLAFFWKVEIVASRFWLLLLSSVVICFGFFLLCLWDSDDTTAAALVLMASTLLSFFAMNPFVLPLVDWRYAVQQEGQAWLFGSSSRRRVGGGALAPHVGPQGILKFSSLLIILIVLSVLQFLVVNAVTGSFSSPSSFWKFDIWLGMIMDSIAHCVPGMILGIFSNMDFTMVQLVGSVPVMLTIFFSTTFSPCSGVQVVKELRYLTSRFYFWCFVPGVQDLMEGCPSTRGHT